MYSGAKPRSAACRAPHRNHQRFGISPDSDGLLAQGRGRLLIAIGEISNFNPHAAGSLAHQELEFECPKSGMSH